MSLPKAWHTKPKKKLPKSKFIGVQNHRGRFRGYVWKHGKKWFTRTFSTAEEAARVRDKWAKAAYEGLAVLNF